MYAVDPVHALMPFIRTRWRKSDVALTFLKIEQAAPTVRTFSLHNACRA